MSAPIFSSFSSIYPGPHVDKFGHLDERVWFSIPIELDLNRGSITYLVFPHGGSDNEIQEITIEAAGYGSADTY